MPVDGNMYIHINPNKILGFLAPVIILILTGIFVYNKLCDGSIWYDHGNLSPREALGLAQDEAGRASFEPEDITKGKGRVVQHGRRITLLVEVLDGAGNTASSGQMSFLYPPIDTDRHQGIPCQVQSGKIPEYFFTCIAGMRAGGVRRIILPSTSRDPDSEPRRFIDAATGQVAAELPQDQEVPLRITILKVCRPAIKLVTTYSVPAMRERRIMELWCW